MKTKTIFENTNQSAIYPLDGSANLSLVGKTHVR